MIIPTTSSAAKPVKGVVVMSGPGEYLQSGDFVPNSVTTGNTVLFVKAGALEATINEKEYLVVEEKDVIAILGE